MNDNSKPDTGHERKVNITNLRFFHQNMSQDCRATVVRQSYDVRASVANLSPLNFGEFTLRKFRNTRTNVVRQSLDSLDKTCEHIATGEKIKLSDIRTNVVIHSHKCLKSRTSLLLSHSSEIGAFPFKSHFPRR